MHPILFNIPLPWGGHFSVASYGVMLALGALAGVYAATRMGRRDNLSRDTIIDLGFWAVIGGLVGAKAWFIIQNWPAATDKMELIRNFRGGLVFYGGLAGASVSVAAFIIAGRHKASKIFDIAAPSAALGLAFGRIGCFLNGCCYGRVTHSHWGVHFPRILDGNDIIGSAAYVDQLNAGLVSTSDPHSLALIPVQLIASAGALTVFVILMLLRRTRRCYGEQTALFFVFYPISRSIMESLRGDNARVLLGMTIPQVASAAAFVVGVAAFLWLRTAAPASLAVEPMRELEPATKPRKSAKVERA